MTRPQWGDMSWEESDALFQRELATGKHCEAVVARELRRQGLVVVNEPMKVRENPEDIPEWTARDTDLLVEGHAVDVKSTSRHFNGPHDFPFPDPMVDTVSGWRGKAKKPCAVILVSQIEPWGYAVVPRSTEATWVIKSRDDRTRGITDSFLHCAREQLQTLAAFVAWIRARATEPEPEDWSWLDAAPPTERTAR